LNTTSRADDDVRSRLKDLKAATEDPAFNWLEAAFMRALSLWPEDLGRWVGEAWHQMGLRAAARGEWDQALERFDHSRRTLTSPLGLARLERDVAWALTHVGKHKEAQQHLAMAVAHHERDRGNVEKAQRQQLITETYRLRIAWHTSPKDEYVRELMRILDHGGEFFCRRDQLVILDFLGPLLVGSEKVRLEVRAAWLRTHHLDLAAASRHAVSASWNLGWLLTQRVVRGILRRE
jgi:hypothetical protein